MSYDKPARITIWVDVRDPHNYFHRLALDSRTIPEKWYGTENLYHFPDPPLTPLAWRDATQRLIRHILNNLEPTEPFDGFRWELVKSDG